MSVVKISVSNFSIVEVKKSSFLNRQQQHLFKDILCRISPHFTTSAPMRPIIRVASEADRERFKPADLYPYYSSSTKMRLTILSEPQDKEQLAVVVTVSIYGYEPDTVIFYRLSAPIPFADQRWIPEGIDDMLQKHEKTVTKNCENLLKALWQRFRLESCHMIANRLRNQTTFLVFATEGLPSLHLLPRAPPFVSLAEDYLRRVFDDAEKLTLAELKPLWYHGRCMMIDSLPADPGAVFRMSDDAEVASRFETACSDCCKFYELRVQPKADVSVLKMSKRQVAKLLHQCAAGCNKLGVDDLMTFLARSGFAFPFAGILQLCSEDDDPYFEAVFKNPREHVEIVRHIPEVAEFLRKKSAEKPASKMAQEEDRQVAKCIRCE